MRAMLAVVVCAFSVLVCTSLAHPLSEEESYELFKSNLDPLRLMMSPVRMKGDLDKREAIVASKRYLDPILFRRVL